METPHLLSFYTSGVTSPPTRRKFDGKWEDCYYQCAGWSSLVARWAHNPKVGGSNPPPATNLKPFRLRCLRGFFIEPTLPPNWDDWDEHRNSAPPCLQPDGDIQALHACVNTCPLFAERNAQSTAFANPPACPASAAWSPSNAEKREDRPSGFPISSAVDAVHV